jgi:hypothetical protein
MGGWLEIRAVHHDGIQEPKALEHTGVENEVQGEMRRQLCWHV